jgi:tetratricopeptide (TPR) repeat protein
LPPGGHCPTHATLDGELKASLDFLKGRDALGRSDLDVARYHFEQSLTYWQKATHSPPLSLPPTPPLPHSSPLSPPPPSPRQKQAVLLFYLGVTCRSQAVLQRIVYERLLHKAEGYFSACLRILRDLQQPDLVGKFIHALAEVQQKLGAWAALARTAEEGLMLHRQDPIRLARDHGYLAEVALAHGEAAAAQAQAERALEILAIAGALNVSAQSDGRAIALPSELAVANQYQRGWYLYLLGRVHIAQGQPEAAIALLEEAAIHTDPKTDLPLHRSILQTLQKQHYRQKNYRESFEVKLKQRQVDTRFRLRAFIGADEIQPRDTLLATADQSTQALLATEMQASGRQVDVEALTDRLEQARYPLLVIHGPSGVGKSSILYAGLIPALGKSFPEGRSTLPVLVKGYRDWADEVNQPWPMPSSSKTPPMATAFPPPPPSTRPTLLNRLKRLTEQSYRQLVLIFDQFEEFFAEAVDLPSGAVSTPF